MAAFSPRKYLVVMYSDSIKHDVAFQQHLKRFIGPWARKRIRDWLSPFHALVTGYMIVTSIGAFLLSLPVSTAAGSGQPFVDALFMATSGISTSGLAVVDVGKFYTLFGQIVLLLVFQIGGIGYMTFIMFFTHAFGMKTSINTQLIAVESLAGSEFRILGRFFITTMTFTFGFEAAGAIVLAIFWLGHYSFAHALYLGIFHSVSAFCTAGFGLFSDSLMKYRESVVMNATINLVSLAGGLGFFVLYELYAAATRIIRRKTRRRLSLHTKLVLIMTAVVVAGGTAVIYLSESWSASDTVPVKFLASSFQAISASTTDGFNSVDIGRMGHTSLVALMLLMFVGASPGSTGGGIKTTTLGVIMLFLVAQLKGKQDAINLMGREIPPGTILKAVGVFSWFIIVLLIDMLVMGSTENAPFLPVIFEIVSALGNTGLSMGITAALSCTGKIMLIATMFIGRVGPLTMGYFIIGSREPLPYRLPEEDLFVG